MKITSKNKKIGRSYLRFYPSSICKCKETAYVLWLQTSEAKNRNGTTRNAQKSTRSGSNGRLSERDGRRRKPSRVFKNFAPSRYTGRWMEKMWVKRVVQKTRRYPHRPPGSNLTRGIKVSASTWPLQNPVRQTYAMRGQLGRHLTGATVRWGRGQVRKRKMLLRVGRKNRWFMEEGLAWPKIGARFNCSCLKFPVLGAFRSLCGLVA